MAKKEKKSGPPTASIVFVGLACFFVVIAGAGYLWNKAQINMLGDQMHGYEMRLESARRRRLALERDYATNCSPGYLEMRVKWMKMDLGLPQPDQIVKLPDGPGGGQEEKMMAGRTILAGEGRN
jgi:hypothetical protein